MCAQVTVDNYTGHVIEYRTRRAAERQAALYNRRFGVEAAYVERVGDVFQVRFTEGEM